MSARPALPPTYAALVAEAERRRGAPLERVPGAHLDLWSFVAALGLALALVACGGPAEVFDHPFREAPDLDWRWGLPSTGRAELGDGGALAASVSLDAGADAAPDAPIDPGCGWESFEADASWCEALGCYAIDCPDGGP